MYIVGELINASRKSVGEAIKAGDAEFIKKLAKDQADAGATFIDVNAGIFVDQEGDYMEWLIKNVQEVTNTPISIDSPDYHVIERALKLTGEDALINSISYEEGRYESILSLVEGTKLKVVALCMDDQRMPETKEDRLRIADILVDGLIGKGVDIGDIFVDPLVQPVSTDVTFGMGFIDAIEGLKEKYPGIHTACGLSNISYGLPERKFLNRTFAVMAIAKGLDGLLIDPLDDKMMTAIKGAEALAGRDKFCAKYMKAYRKKQLSI
ncbi:MULTISPECIES: dihydropteroate synthase [Eubacterium]|uniref:5-methyltetrahydrofolate--homocysteine methyltransferase n=1 Tax=Eubacterium barkeri TaxID=1528 RepID=A0A1H3AVR8_EUBBA|nr:dihydropteroate synthase [Eubacterium barkeri]SDX32929.1 5-methyltetrahydrofolate--homocysteine methyltransferase [Eubacterium barkeri]